MHAVGLLSHGRMVPKVSFLEWKGLTILLDVVKGKRLGMRPTEWTESLRNSKDEINSEVETTDQRPRNSVGTVDANASLESVGLFPTEMIRSCLYLYVDGVSQIPPPTVCSPIEPDLDYDERRMSTSATFTTDTDSTREKRSLTPGDSPQAKRTKADADRGQLPSIFTTLDEPYRRASLPTLRLGPYPRQSYSPSAQPPNLAAYTFPPADDSAYLCAARRARVARPDRPPQLDPRPAPGLPARAVRRLGPGPQETFELRMHDAKNLVKRPSGHVCFS
ncbi:hypothetical protein C0993_005243 [Termitomyces sp. T159_Od127]|nr:hypothetical protein C0993_005243 [Termitomyces sp. T159_Od127]